MSASKRLSPTRPARFGWRKILRIAGVAPALMFGLAQLVRTPRNVGLAEGSRSLVSRETVPPEMRELLARACYDCHSDHTRYPWYAHVQPVAWWLDRHVQEGRTALNFSAFADYEPKRAVRKLQAVADEVHDRQMPLPSYLWLHHEARLSEADTARLVDWAETLAEEIASR